MTPEKIQRIRDNIRISEIACAHGNGTTKLVGSITFSCDITLDSWHAAQHRVEAENHVKDGVLRAIYGGPRSELARLVSELEATCAVYTSFHHFQSIVKGIFDLIPFNLPVDKPE